MSTDYWTLRADVTCPEGHQFKGRLQTHYLGHDASMSHTYEIGEPVSELVGIAAAIIDGQSEDHELMSSCPQCALTCRYGAEIRDERITRVWLLPKNQGRRLER